jgi:hypothetical protein
VPEIKSLYLKMLAKRQGFISAFLDRAESGKPAERSVY